MPLTRLQSQLLSARRLTKAANLERRALPGRDKCPQTLAARLADVLRAARRLQIASLRSSPVPKETLIGCGRYFLLKTRPDQRFPQRVAAMSSVSEITKGVAPISVKLGFWWEVPPPKVRIWEYPRSLAEQATVTCRADTSHVSQRTVRALRSTSKR